MPNVTLNPSVLDRNKAPEALSPEEARRLVRVDLASEPGVLSRGRGQVRPDVATGFTATVSGAVNFTRRDGVIVHVLGYSGTWAELFDPQPSSLTGA